MLLGLVDSDYKFIFIEVGCQRGISAAGGFRNMELYNRFVSDKLNLSGQWSFLRVKTQLGTSQANR